MFKSTDKFHLLTQKAFKNYQLKQNEYLLFWDYIQESSDNLIYFFSELTHTIMRLENSKKSSKLESLDSIIATLYCLSMFKKILADKKRFIIISDLEKEWQLYDKTRYGSMIRSPYSGEIVNCVFQFLLKSDDKSRIENILDQIAIIPGSVKKFINISNNSQNNISLADLEYNSFQVISEGNLEAFHKAFSKFAKRLNAYHKQIKQDSLEKLSTLLNKEEYEPEETGECSLIYEYFIQFLNENKKKKNTTIPDYIINSLLTNLRVIPFIALRYPKHAENSLLCLLYIIKQILIFFPLGPTTEHEEQEILSILIGLIKNYITWPFPIGFLAVELIDILKSEIIATGNSFRYRIREEIPALDILDYELRKNVTYLRIAYCIYNENYYSIISGIKSQNSENFDEKTNNFISLDAHKIRVLIIAHVFSIHYKITRDLLMHMSYLNPTDIFRIYCKLLNILEKCENVDSLDIINLQEKTLDELSLEIYNCVTENSEVSFKIQDLLFQEFQSFLPTYPDVFLELVDHRQNNINIDDKIKKLPVIPEIEENNMEDNNGGKFDERKILGNFTLKLKELLEEIIQNSFPLHQESFKIVVFGEDEELHSLVQELGVLFKMNYLLFTNIDIRIFIIPVGRCTMGKYLASKDLW